MYVIHCLHMTRISKQKLDKKTHDRLFSEFTRLFASASERQHADLFVSLFSETEKIMFIKRLAIVFLLGEEYSTYAISNTLLVSDSTVRVIRTDYNNGRFDPIVTIMKKRTFNKDEFWKTVEVLLRAGLPPRGRGRWKWLYEMK